MQYVFYATALAGCCSLGYMLLRTGFPRMQEFSSVKKLLFGYLLGAIIFVPAIAASFFLTDKAFFILSGAIFLALFVIFFVKRSSFGEKDSSKLSVEKPQIELPKRVLTTEEKKTGLRIKERESTQKAEIGNEQIFKGKESNVDGLMSELRQNTGKIEESAEEQRKKEALEKLRSFAKQIKETKKEPGEKKEKEETDDYGLEVIGDEEEY